MSPRHVRGIAISAWWVLVIIVPICVGVLWIAVAHSNAAQDAALRHSNQQFAKSLIVTDRKFQQALRITNAQTAYSINKSVCGFRGFIIPTLKSYKAAAKDPTLSASARARNDRRIKTTQAFLDAQVTVPSDFDCSTLPKNPPTKATP